MKEKFWRIKKDAEIPFHNNVDYCIGTGRMGLALQKEYQDQLELVQKEIGFSHIRGHGLFSDDMAIYQEYSLTYPASRRQGRLSGPSVSISVVSFSPSPRGQENPAAATSATVD